MTRRYRRRGTRLLSPYGRTIVVWTAFALAIAATVAAGAAGAHP